MTLGAAGFARLLEIAGVNILFSGDNAIVVAMVIRNLPPTQRNIASMAGISLAMLAETAAVLTVAWLLKLGPVSLAGGILLAMIAIGLLRENGNTVDATIHHAPGRGLLHATITVAGAYLVGCLDNILAVAAVGRGAGGLVVLGLLTSGAVLVPANLVIANLMKRFPLMLKLGAAIVGWTAGSMIAAALAPRGQMLRGSTSEFFIPALMTFFVASSPLWWRPRIRGPSLIKPD